MRTSLYRHFDVDGALLYVGIALNPVARQQRHRGVAGWYRNIATISLKWYRTRHAAMRAERRAIKTERPRYNRPNRKPKLSRRQFERLETAILEEKDATVAELASRFKIAEITLRQWFPDWRAKTDEQRKAFRATKPFPEK